MRSTSDEHPPCPNCGALRWGAGICEPCGCAHRNLHPGRYEGARTVCLDCRTEVLILGRTGAERDRYLEYEDARYVRGRALAGKSLKTAPLWPTTRVDYDALSRPGDDEPEGGADE